MDIAVIRDKVLGWIRKYRYVLLVLLVGVFLMLIPTGRKDVEEQPPVETAQPKPQLEMTSDRLEEILGQIQGAGRVKVLLTFAGSEKTLFQTNDRSSSTEESNTLECETVLLMDSDRTEEALVTQVLAPEYLGAVIVCQGADDPSVRLAVTEAVSKATGLGSDRISVLKMK